MTVVSLSVKNAAAAAAPSTSKDGVPEVNTAKASAQYYRDALTRTLTELGWRQATGFPSPRCAIVWHDEPLRLQHLLALPRGARINRFYGMVRICRKVCLARLLDACGRLHPAAFGGAAPRTWCVGASWPQGAAAHRAHCDALKDGASAAFILKPDSGCQGAGIRLHYANGDTVDHRLRNLPNDKVFSRKLDSDIFANVTAASYSSIVDGVRTTSPITIER